MWFHLRVSDSVLKTVNGGTCLKANMLKAKLCLIIKIIIIKIRLKKHVQVALLLKKTCQQTWPKFGLLLTSHQWDMFYFVASPKGKLPDRPRDFATATVKQTKKKLLNVSL